MDIGEKILHNSISFLQSVSAAMPNKFAAAKSFYATKSSILQLKDNESKRLKIWKKEDMKCTRCCLSFNDYPPQVYLLRKKRPNRFAAKVTRKIEKKYPLTRYQLKYSERLKNINTRTIIRRCQQCKNEVKQCFKMPSYKLISLVNKN
ncbi:hypothetical protein HHI36_005511 [Cryptolaemus montrouzieri]|uniref:Uncharacterized protein n=1 Tax=Cryptolaemus montrouzieri TaxID=559131 RepID=A0ABD2NUX9_9CUCU